MQKRRDIKADKCARPQSRQEVQTTARTEDGKAGK